MKNAGYSILIALVIGFTGWGATRIVDALAWDSELQPLEHVQRETADTVQQILRQQIQRDVRDLSRELRDLERRRETAPDNWTVGDQKYFNKLLDELDSLNDDLDAVDDD